VQAPEFRGELHNLAYTAEVNQRYHHLKQRQMWLWDKVVKIGVAVLAVLALIAAFVPHELKWLEVTAALLAALAAVALNVVPVGEWITEYGEMFRSWSDLLLDAEQLELKAREIDDGAPVPIHLVERLQETINRQCQLDAMEPPPDDKLLSRCQGDINERMYGKGVRTYAQAMEAHSNAKEVGVNHA
jgi:hypothetical protein